MKEIEAKAGPGMPPREEALYLASYLRGLSLAPPGRRKLDADDLLLIARASRLLLESLGIERLFAATGPGPGRE